ncbi:MAG: SpaA isopeptide-forming pilin-related protein [Clostridium sp.]
MSKRKLRVFVTCLLFLVMCSSFVSALAEPRLATEQNKEGTVSENGQDVDIEDGSNLENKEKPEEKESSEENKNLEENKKFEDARMLEEKQDEQPKKIENVDKEIENEVKKLSKNLTTDTFESAVGAYSLETILNRYNIFSFDKINGAHVVGPIVGKDTERLDIGEKGGFTVSDFSNETPSYIGKIHRYDKGLGIQDVAMTLLNYGFEKPEAKKPNLYINESDNGVKIENGMYRMQDEKGLFKGPNNWGNSPILQNDNFIDFEKANIELMRESKKLLEDSGNIVVGESSKYKIDARGRLNLDVGKNYIIEDASRLESVNFIFPEGYGPMINLYPYSTVINIKDDKLKQKVMENKSQNLLPNKYVNGKIFSGMIFGGTPGFGDGQIGKMNKIIWNMPNIRTTGEEGRLVTDIQGDILGHILAPNAEFWNYVTEVQGDGTEKKVWRGGNINGCAIVKEWYGGYMESHFWPYGDKEIGKRSPESVEVAMNGRKIFNKGVLGDEKFSFELKYEGEVLPDGVKPDNIPQIVSQKEDGKIEFLPIIFTKPGVYNFIIKELSNKEKTDIIYDETIYKAKVTVFRDNNGDLAIKTEFIKINDSEQVVGDEIVFVNEKILSFQIEKKDNITNELLKGAIFDLYEANENGEPVGEPIIKAIETDETGKVTVKNEKLEYNKLYVLVETRAPEDYLLGDNIIFYIKGSKGPYPTLAESIIIENKGNVEITNKKSDEILPATGGNGTIIYTLIGLGLIFSAITLLRLRKV